MTSTDLSSEMAGMNLRETCQCRDLVRPEKGRERRRSAELTELPSIRFR